MKHLSKTDLIILSVVLKDSIESEIENQRYFKNRLLTPENKPVYVSALEYINKDRHILARLNQEIRSI